MLCARHVLGAVFKHARRFGWTTANPLENVHRPRHQYEVRAFTPEQIRMLLEAAGPETGLIVRTLASTGLRFGELAGLRWSAVDLERGVIEVREQYTHGAWSELKTANARRSIPLRSALRDQLKARYHRALNRGSLVLRPREDERLVFTSPEGGEIEYNNWRTRQWLPLLEATGPDEKHPKRVPITGTPHMLRHYATALIQSGENAKTVQTLMGHHSVAFTMDHHADASPEAQRRRESGGASLRREW